MPKEQQKRPEEYIDLIISKLHKDIGELFTVRFFKIMKMKSLSVEDNAVFNAEIAKLTVSVAKGLKSLVNYSKSYALKKHNDK